VSVDQARTTEQSDDKGLGRFGVLAGPLTEPPEGPYRVRFQKLRTAGGRGAAARTALIVVANVAVEAAFVLWLLAPEHRPDFDNPWQINAANFFVIGAVALVEGMRLVNVFSLSLASLLARDPVPVRPDPTMRVAFLTTIVPGKEPLDMVRTTLRAARKIRYPGRLDVWLLDEGDSGEVRAMCAAEGVRHFSRKDVEQYNQARGAFKAKTKHGNYNAWLDRHGHRYDVFMSVDPDHVPTPAYADRMLGYFRDPDVGFVVGPQCYANVDNFVTRAAESQQFPFHSVVQRAGNAYGVAMLVGTNNAVRIDALGLVGGLSDSITEDFATGLAIHSRRNPETGVRWRSVYTPDVVAVGEGPSSWADYFGQQLRWSRGTFELLRGPFWRRPLHYLLIATFYPSMALGWVLGLINATLYLTLGASGIVVPPTVWLALYVDATLFQLWVYVRNRRHNVSPFEDEGSPGLRGMVMSVLTSPIYAASLVASVVRMPARFVVTAKDAATTRDSLRTFWRHLIWALLLVGAITVAFREGYAEIDVLMWPALALLITMAPLVLSWLDPPPAVAPVPGDADVPAPRAESRPDPEPAPVTEPVPGPETAAVPELARTDLETVS
jgi:cellulose synthase/poly-beta-1,6-N-acetylglucosamine synthase-like glycosyltransferase